MQLADHVYRLGPQYGTGTNPTGSEILVTPVEVVDPHVFSSLRISSFTMTAPCD